MAVINFPIIYINDPETGKPLFEGKIFVGQPDLDPEIVGNQKQLNIVQENGTVIPIPQPAILSQGGRPQYKGDPVRLDVSGNYSIKILDKNGAQKYYIENVFEGQPITSLDLINDLSQAYEFATVAEYKAFTTAFPVGKKITLLDRKASFTVIAGTGSANDFNVIASDEVNQSIDLLEQDTGVTTAQCGFVDDFSVNSQNAVNAALNNFNKVTFSTGTYRPLLISQSNKLFKLDEDVIFKLPDNTSSPTETVPFSTLDVTGNNNVFAGVAYIDGNSANNSSAMTNLSHRKGSFAMQGDNNTWNGDVVILDAYYVGYSIGSDDAGACKNFTHSGIAKNVSSVNYAFAMWSCLDCHIDTVLSTDSTQDLSHRIRTGTQTSSTKECKNLTINTIKGADMVGVFETKTVNMQVGKINLAAWKCEESKDFQVGEAISSGCVVDAVGFGLNNVDGFQADSILVKDFTGGGGTDFASFIKGKRITIGSIHVDENNADGEDFLMQTFEDVSIGRIVLTNPKGNSKGFVMDESPSFAPQKRMEIGAIISSGHTGLDVEFQNYRSLDASVGYINTDATVNTDLEGVQGQNASETGIFAASLVPSGGGSISLNQSTLAYTRQGRVVHIQGRLRVASVSSPSGTLELSNLPYEVSNLTSEADVSVPSVFGSGFTGGSLGTVLGQTIQATSRLQFYAQNNESFVDIANRLQANTIIRFQLTYITDD